MSRIVFIFRVTCFVLIFATILGLLTFYAAPLSIFRNRFAAAAWGLIIGGPAAVIVVGWLYGETDAKGED
jgi:hypothetical protein